MYCNECFKENPENSLFCENCGCPFSTSGSKGGNRLFKDRYKIISSLSAGGAISLVYDIALNRACAMKKLYNKSLRDLTSEERDAIIKPFKREAELLANLRHPNLPCVTDYFVEDTSYYLVMDYIEGKDLEVIREETEDNRISEKQVIEWFIQVCRILEYLHEQNPPVIHKDIKPANLIIRDSDGWIMLVDFGTASSLEEDEENIYLTDGYAPPEQYEGIQDIRSDIYSVGATMYELLTGTLPEEGFEYIPVREIIPEISSDMENIVMKCLEYEQDARYQNASELKQKLLEAYKNNFIKSQVTQKMEKKEEPKKEEETKICPSCNVVNRLKAKHCKNCGSNFDKPEKEEVIEEVVYIEVGEGEEEGEEIVEEIIEEIIEDEEIEAITEEKIIPETSEEQIKEKPPITEIPSVISKDTDKNKSKGEEHKEIAMKYISKDEIDFALIYLKEALKLIPEDPMVNLELSGIYYKKNELDLALKHSITALKNNNENIEINLLTGKIYLRKGDFSNAIIYFNKVIEVDPKNIQALLELAYIKYKNGEFEDAEKYYTSITRLKADSFEAYLGLGNVYSAQKNYENSIKFYGEALKRKQNVPEVYKNLGLIYIQENKYLEALRYLKTALSLDKETSEFYDELIDKIRNENEEWHEPYDYEYLKSFLISKIKRKEKYPFLYKIIHIIKDEEKEKNRCPNCKIVNIRNVKSCKNCHAEFMHQKEMKEHIKDEVIQLILIENEEKIFSEKPVKISELIKAGEELVKGIFIIIKMPSKKEEYVVEEEVYAVCHKCEGVNRVDARFCGKCGIKFEGEEVEIVEVEDKMTEVIKKNNIEGN